MTFLVGAVALAAAAALLYAAARGALARCGERSRAVAAAVALAALAVVPAEVARFTGDLRAGLVATALAAGALALWLGRSSQADDARPPAWALAVLALPLVGVAVAAVRGVFFDDPQHWPMALEIARGVVPPRVTTLPDVVHAYHWGFDALTACVVNAGLTVAQAEDVVTCGSFVLLLAVLWVAGLRATGGRRGALVVALGVPLAGSPLALPLWVRMPSPWPVSWADRLHLPQPPILFFFQHPQGLAMPLFVAVVLVLAPLSPRAAHERSAARVVGGVVLALVSLCNVVYFEALGVALGVAAVARFAADRDTRALVLDLAALLLAAAGAAALGGILAGAPALRPGSFFDEGPGLALVHHVVVFGLPLLALPVLLVLGLSRRALPAAGVGLVVAAALLFALPSFVVLRDTWDIVKLYDVAGFAAGLVLFSAVGRALEAGRRALPLAFAALTMVTPAAVLAKTAIDPPVELTFDPAVESLRRAFSPHIPARARVLTDDPTLSTQTGFLTPGFLLTSTSFDPYAYLHVDRAAVEAKAHTWARAVVELDAADLDALGVDFVVVTPSFARRLSRAGRAALADELRFVPVTRAGDAVLLRVLR